MTCGDCERPFTEVMDFLVATPIWNFVMAGQKETTYTVREGLFPGSVAGELYPRVEGVGGVVCLACFDRRARDRGINYRESLVVFGVDCWMGYDTVRMPLVGTENEQDYVADEDDQKLWAGVGGRGCAGDRRERVVKILYAKPRARQLAYVWRGVEHHWILRLRGGHRGNHYSRPYQPRKVTDGHRGRR